MSRCKRHTTDLSSTVGVCASCLRERLFAIMAVQAQAQKQAQLLQQSSENHPLNFPRSVSPYITRRKSDAAAKWQLPNGHDTHHRWFYSTPQVGPTGSVTLEIRRDQNQSKRMTKKKLASVFSGFFRSKQSDSLESGGSSESTSSWLTNVFSTRRRKKKQNKTFSLDDSSVAAAAAAAATTTTSRVPGTRVSNRGMSPARRSWDDADEEEEGGDASSGESAESTPWRQLRFNNTPAVNPSSTRRRTVASSCRNAPTGFAFCLSPLVRASPNHRNWSQELSIGGNSSSRASHLSSTTSLCKSRSRKLADFGRYNSYSGKCNR